MNYLKFDKYQLVNLEHSLSKEILRTNKSGTYSCTTLTGCNTRKYHGLFVCQLDELDGNKHVLLSSLDTTIIQHGEEFNLGIHKYPGGFYEPKGHKYIRDFSIDTIPKTTYRVGGVVLSMERLLIENTDQLIVKYTLEDAHSDTTLRFRPFLAFRCVHDLSKENLYAEKRHGNTVQGTTHKLYESYPELFLQLSKKNEFIEIPDWYKNIEYTKEKERGYDYHEDLFVPGYFEVPIQKGESVYFSCSLEEMAYPENIETLFRKELHKRKKRDSFHSYLTNASNQFLVKRKNRMDLSAGYPWYDGVVTQTFVSIPGMLENDTTVSVIENILDTQVKKLSKGLFPKYWGVGRYIYDTMDASMYFFVALQKLEKVTDDPARIWKKYGKYMLEIIRAFREGTLHDIKMHSNGLISGGDGSVPLTWMDAMVQGAPVTPRNGFPVEVNAMWYNAIRYTQYLSKLADESSVYKELELLSPLVKRSFRDMFWSEEKGYLADNISLDGTKDWSVRPNMLIAVSLDCSPVTREVEKKVLSCVKKELLTPKGIRSLSPKDSRYKGDSKGTQDKRSLAMHQGNAHPWLVALFVKSYLRVHKKGGISFCKSILNEYQKELNQHCVGSISEVYSGNPPYEPSGAISQAWSVNSLLLAAKEIREVEYKYEVTSV
ncbi:amylo-alpha-1,6-glucosidase [Halosquirtibacter laminarini]|uniref:Amylo-alpha-1,6-glucosidase n=1 Tax=Halosquirtibacter laminarini TaxID=3374600 RepID=A0AC61NN18_9BACT|nr:amylo-alpha-1,6-glucosidase [Prolixibacteraceae bacterium]